MTRIKICGIQPEDDLSFTAHPSVAHIGIIFAEQSRRYVPPERARTIIDDLHPSCRAMGVFVDKTVADIVEMGHTARLHGVQLHGHETIGACDALRREGFVVWKAISGPKSMDTSEIAGQLRHYAPHVDGILLDAPPPPEMGDKGVTGGLGIQFDWSGLPQLLDSFAQDTVAPPVWIAGGIDASNVATLHAYWRPYGVDVSSSVEIDGRKSIQKIEQFIEAVTQLD